MGKSDFDTHEYDSTVIDWEELEGLARQVAESTHVPPREELNVARTKEVTRRVEAGSTLFGLRTRYKDVVENQSLEEKALGPHWVLDIDEMDWATGGPLPSRTGARVDKRKIAFTYALEPDGKLTKVCDFTHMANTGSGTFLMDYYLFVGPFDEHDVEIFDWTKLHTFREGRSPKDDWVDAGEDIRVRPIISQTKGEGLKARLNQLLKEGSPLPPIRGENRDMTTDGDCASYPVSSICMSRMEELRRGAL